VKPLNISIFQKTFFVGSSFSSKWWNFIKPTRPYSAAFNHISQLTLTRNLNVLFIGDPHPSVLWYKNDELIDKTFIANEKGVVQNTLTLPRYVQKIYQTNFCLESFIIIKYFMSRKPTLYPGMSRSSTKPISVQKALLLTSTSCQEKPQHTQVCPEILPNQFLSRKLYYKQVLPVKKNHNIPSYVQKFYPTNFCLESFIINKYFLSRKPTTYPVTYVHWPEQFRPFLAYHLCILRTAIR
jgi:hypothetical protein